MPIQTLIKTNDSIFINNIYRILLFLDLKMDLISEIYFLLSFFEMPSLYFSQSDHLFVCATEKHYVSRSFTHLWSVYNSMLFKYIGGLVASDQKMAFFFFFFFASFLLAVLFGFVFILRIMRCWNPEISELSTCIWNQRWA